MDNQKRYKIEERILHEVTIMLMLMVIVALQKIIIVTWLGLSINIVLLVVVLRALIDPLTVVARWALYGGFLLDITSAARLGMHSMVLIIAIIVVYVLLSRITSENWILPILSVVVGGIVYYVCNGLLLLALFGGYDVLTYVTAVALPELLVIVIPALPVFLLLRWLRSIRRGELPLDVY